MNESTIYESAARRRMIRAGMDPENAGIVTASNPNIVIETEHARCIGQLMAAVRGFDRACGGYCGFSMLQDMPDDELKAKLLAEDPDIDDRLRMTAGTGRDAFLHEYRSGAGTSDRDEARRYAGIVCMRAMEAVHDARCSEHIFEYRKPGERHLFLPFGMIGIDGMMRYADFTEPLLDAAGMPDLADRNALESAYADAAIRYRLEHKLYNRDDVAAFIAKGGGSYHGLSGMDGIRKDYADAIADGILEDFYGCGAGRDIYAGELHDGYVNVADADIHDKIFGTAPSSGFRPVSVPAVYTDDKDGISIVMECAASDVKGGMRVPSECASPIPMHDIYDAAAKRTCSKRLLSGIMRHMAEDDWDGHERGPEL